MPQRAAAADSVLWTIGHKIWRVNHKGLADAGLHSAQPMREEHVDEDRRLRPVQAWRHYEHDPAALAGRGRHRLAPVEGGHRARELTARGRAGRHPAEPD